MASSSTCHLGLFLGSQSCSVLSGSLDKSAFNRLPSALNADRIPGVDSGSAKKAVIKKLTLDKNTLENLEKVAAKRLIQHLTDNDLHEE